MRILALALALSFSSSAFATVTVVLEYAGGLKERASEGNKTFTGKVLVNGVITDIPIKVWYEDFVTGQRVGEVNGSGQVDLEIPLAEPGSWYVYAEASSGERADRIRFWVYRLSLVNPGDSIIRICKNESTGAIALDLEPKTGGDTATITQDPDKLTLSTTSLYLSGGGGNTFTATGRETGKITVKIRQDQEPNCEVEITIEVLEIDRIEYMNNGAWSVPPSPLVVALGDTVQFRAIAKDNMEFDANHPEWSGSSGVNGTGPMKTVTFGTLSNTVNDFKTVIATCGGSVTANVLVVGVNFITGPTSLLVGQTVTYEAVPIPDGAPFPTGQPIWGGSLGVNGTGATSNSFTAVVPGEGDVEARCGLSFASLHVRIASARIIGPENVPGLSTYRYSVTVDPGSIVTINSWRTSRRTATIAASTAPNSTEVEFRNRPFMVTIFADVILNGQSSELSLDVAVVEVDPGTPTFTAGGAYVLGGVPNVPYSFKVTVPYTYVTRFAPGSNLAAFTALGGTPAPGEEYMRFTSSGSAAFTARTTPTLTAPPERPEAIVFIQAGYIQNYFGAGAWRYTRRGTRTIIEADSNSVDWLSNSNVPGPTDEWPWYDTIARWQPATAIETTTTLTLRDTPSTFLPKFANPASPTPGTLTGGRKNENFSLHFCARTTDAVNEAETRYFTHGVSSWTVTYRIAGATTVDTTPNRWRAPRNPTRAEVDIVPSARLGNFPFTLIP